MQTKHSYRSYGKTLVSDIVCLKPRHVSLLIHHLIVVKFCIETQKH